MIKTLLSSVILKMDQLSTPLIKLSLFIIFFWFGALKPLGISAAESLVFRYSILDAFFITMAMVECDWILGDDYRGLFSF